MLRLTFLLTCLLTLWAAPVLAQGDDAALKVKNAPLPQVLRQLELKTDYRFLYINDDLKGYTFSGKLTLKDINSTMTQLLEGKPLGYTINQQYITITKQGAQPAASTYVLKGKVVDENGAELPGVNIRVQGSKTYAVTGLDGNFSIEVHAGDVLRFTFIGYREEIVAVKGKKTLDVDMRPDAHTLKDVQVVAFGTQKKESVVSSITSIRPGDLKTSSSDLTTSFAGRIPGMVAWQTGGMPGAMTENEMNTKFYVRGITSFQSGANTDPLILIDGVESSKVDLARLTVEDIETFNVMKDASATAMYGARGANGVILVTTKKGEEGTVYTSVRYEAIMSEPTKEIDVVNPIDYMKYYNQAQLDDNPSATPKYSQERIAMTASGKYPSWAYPANDWYSTLFKKRNINHHVGVNIRGGSKIMQYYVSLNYNHDSGMLKTDKLNQFDVNINTNQLSFRTNLTIDLKPGMRLLLSSATNWDKYHGPLANVQEAYSYVFQASPVDFAPSYPADDTYNWPHIRFGVPTGSSTVKDNPYAYIHSGYQERNRYSTSNRIEYIYNLSRLIKGLEFRANVSLVKTGYYSTPYKLTPYLYSLKEYDNQTGKFSLTPTNQTEASRTLTIGDKDSYGSTQLTYEARLYHTAAWGDHQTSLTAVANAEQKSDNQADEVLNAMEHRNMGLSMRGTYGFKDRYFAEASFGYNGSERFAKKNKMGFFPAVGAAYVLSKEKFMKPLEKIIPFLKLRYSWGKVGNDGIIDEPRFVYLEQVNQRGSIDPRPGVGLANTKGYKIKFYANPNIKWEVNEQNNLGIETKLFNGLFDIQMDFYKQVRHNILDYRRVVPANMGLEYYQLANIGEVKAHGFDFSGKIQKAFTPDFWVILNTTFTYSRAKFKSLEEAADKPEWQRQVGHDISQQIGYIAEGLFHDQAEIDNAPTQSGDVRPGDIRYRDINGDGKIDINDAVHIGYPTTPRIIYGFNGNINYKQFEFLFAFQGSGQRSFFIDPEAITPFWGGTAMLQAIADDHWTTDNMNSQAFWPRLSLRSITYHNAEENRSANNSVTTYSTYFMRSCHFLRCTSLEFAYNVPAKILRKMGAKTLRIYVRANNPFLISNFKLWDVELGSNGFNYPIQRTYSAGFNFSF